MILRSFSKTKELLKKNENQIPLIFIEEDVKFTYNLGNLLNSNQSNLIGTLCPLFYLQISYNNKLYNISSREIQNHLTEYNFENKILNFHFELLSNKGEAFSNQKIVVFFNDENKIDELKKIIQSNERLKMSQFLLILIVDSAETKVKKSEKFLIAQLTNGQSVREIFGQNNFLILRNDSHIIA